VRRYYLGMRRLWWVIATLVAAGLLGAIPFVGPGLGAAVLVWMIVGLVLAKPRPDSP